MSSVFKGAVELTKILLLSIIAVCCYLTYQTTVFDTYHNVHQKYCSLDTRTNRSMCVIAPQTEVKRRMEKQFNYYKNLPSRPEKSS